MDLRPLKTGCFGLVLTLLATAETVADELGKILAQQGTGSSAPCASCHGSDGFGNAALGAPMLAGMNAGYLKRALQAYADGTRVGTMMPSIASQLSSEQMQAAASYYAGLSAAPKDWELVAGDMEKGRTIVEEGAWSVKVPPCTTCHGVNAEGVGANFPRLAGQLPKYMQARVQAWREGRDTADDPNEGLMVAIAKALDNEDMTAAINYLATRAPNQGPSLDYPEVALDWAEVPFNVEDLPAEIPWNKVQEIYEKQQARMARPDAYEHTPPPFSAIPGGPEGELIRLGRFLFSNTQVLRGTFTNNDLSCANCHINDGASPDAAPMWPAPVKLPHFRSKNQHVNTLAERIAGCFTFSMNGTPPPAQHRAMVALEAYFKWLAKGIPSDAVLKVRGYNYLPLPEATPDYARGEQVYKDRCQVCHGADGRGVKTGERTVFPPLWGPESYNWGAGMHTMHTLSAFVKDNMPIGNPDLTEQQAWDVARYVNSHERPQDPRWKGNVQATRNAHHGHVCAYGLETPNGLMGNIGEPLPKPEPLPWEHWATQ